ncbi:TonB-dependent receptor [Rikenella microfusus]|uniref:TonB-dependent receptor n=1 Tax=Rikenella microfusus TaxID=28139 RepID=UPI00248E9CED|nr:TonB-dependent receptor [Rikenella microfusus]
MRNYLFALLLVFLCVGSRAQEGEGLRGTVYGTVTDAVTHEGVPFAQVVVEGGSVGALADSAGRYRIERVPTGYRSLKAASVGYREVITPSFLVTASAASEVNIELEMEAARAGEVVVTGRAMRHTENQPLGNRALSLQQIEKSPGGNRDISKVVQNLPGVAATPIQRNDLIVRGGGPNENKFYLDRIEIPILNHFTTQGASGGNVSIVNSDFLAAARLYTSTFPVGRASGLSSVLDLRMREGNSEKLRVKATVGASDLALTIDSPVGKKGNIIASVRQSYLQVLFGLLELPFLPTYNDAQIKYSHHFDSRNHLYIVGLGSLDRSRLNFSMKDLTPDRQQILEYLPENDQWSYVLGAVYTRYTSGGSLNIVASTDRLNNSLQKWQNNDPAQGKNIDYRSNESGLRFRAEYDADLGRGFALSAGGGLQRAAYDNRTFRRLSIDGVAVDERYSTDISLVRYAAFASVDKSLAGGRVHVNVGLRLDGNSYSAQTADPLEQFSPRLGASYRFAPRWTVSASAGRYYQEPPYTSMGYRDGTGRLVNRQRLRYIRSDQATVGVAFEPTRRSRLSLEGFYKHYDRYPISLIDSTAIGSKGADVFAVGAEPAVSDGRGRAYGFEAEYRNDDLWGFLFTAAYTYYHSEFRRWERGTPAPRGAWTPSNWDYRHLLSLVVMRSLPRGWDVGLRWRYAGGGPYTPYDAGLSSEIDSWQASHRPVADYSLVNSERLPAFHQLDVRIDKTWYFRRWTLGVYLDIQNAYNYKAYGQPGLMPERDATGRYVPDPARPGHYKMMTYEDELGGTIIPTFGITVGF